MGNAPPSSPLSSAPGGEDEEYDDPHKKEDQQELALLLAEETSLLLLSPSLSYDSTVSSSSTLSPDKTKKKKRQHAAATDETRPTSNLLHRQARDLAAMCFWVDAFLNQFHQNQLTTPGITIADDGYTPEETMHMLFAHQHQQQEHPSNNNNSNNHPQQQQQDPSVSFLMDSLQELHEQCNEYMNAHSQPGAPRIINARSRLRRRQRLIERPMTLLLSSSSYRKEGEEEELFYGIVKDDVHERIVLVFHETQAMQTSSSTTSSSSWQDLIHVHQVHVPLPSTLQGKVPRDPSNNETSTTLESFVDSIELRADLYHFLFSNNDDNNNNNNNQNTASRYQTMLSALQHVLRAHPSYTFHVTGFGRAAASAVMVAFFLAAEPQAVLYNHVLFTTNPIVNCLTFACPRVGDAHFLHACQYLEKGGGPQQQQQQQQQRQALDGDDHDDGGRHFSSSPSLRMGRIVVNDGNNNDNDASALVPMWNYSHVGFQIRLYQNVQENGSNSSKAPEITYPKLVDHWRNRWSRTCGNAISIPSFWKLLQQQPQDSTSPAAAAAAANYRMAIQQAQDHLQEYKEGLTSLYHSRDEDGSNSRTGF